MFGRRPARFPQGYGGTPLSDFDFTLSDSELAVESGVEEDIIEGNNVVPASADEVEALFKRVTALKIDESDATKDGEFAMREASFPAPKTGTTTLSVYPPPENTAAAAKPAHASDGSLQVLRYLPEGELSDVAPHLSITFSAPMIQLGTVEDVANQTVPVSLNPTPEGRWRWLGTKTIVFEPKYRFPLSTRFEVVVHKGAKAVNGEVLAEEKKFWFSTPTVKITNWWPAGRTARDTPFFIAFDQRIEPSAIFTVVKLAHEQKNLDIELLDNTIAEKHEEIKQYIKAAQKDDEKGIRWIAFKPKELLPYNSEIKISVGPNIPSAEGPLKSTGIESRSICTYGPFALIDSTNSKAIPNSELRFELSNPIDHDSANAEEIEVSPPIPNLKVRVERSYLYLSGKTGRGTYKIKFPQSLKDIYGQNLEPNQTAEVNVGPARKYFQAAHQGPFIFHDSYKTLVATCNVRKVKIIVKQLNRDEFLNSPFNLQNTRAAANFRSNPARTLAERLGGDIGKVVLDKVIDIPEKDDQYEVTEVDLRSYLQYPEEGLGHIAFGLEPVDWDQDHQKDGPYTPGVAYGVATKIGLDTFHDNQTLYVWANGLSNGVPLSEVTIDGKTFSETKTSVDGTAAITLERERIAGKSDIVFAALGKDWTFILHTWRMQNPNTFTILHGFTDRLLYKPKEEVTVKGYYRKNVPGRYRYKPEILANETLEWRTTDSRNNELAKGTFTTNEFGAFNFTFSIPDKANLGSAMITIGKQPIHNIVYKIEEFRRPEFKSSCSSSSGPHLKDGSAVVTASAEYYSGGNLSDVTVNWEVRATRTSYYPPKLGKYSFGTEIDHAEKSKNFSSKTDVSGSHNLLIKWNGPQEITNPITISANTNIIDFNYQTISASTSFIIHPSNLYVGAQSSKRFTVPKQKVPLKLVASDIAGNLVGGVPIHIAYIKKDDQYNPKTKKWEKNRIRTLISTVESSASGDIDFKAKFDEPGAYLVELSIEDSIGRRNVTTIDVWVAGFRGVSAEHVQQEEIKLETDKTTYSQGEVAKVSLVSTLSDSEGLYVFTTDRIEYVKRFKLVGNSVNFDVTIPEEAFSASLIIELLGNNGVKAIASHTLNIDRKVLELGVTVTPQEESIKPGQSTDVHIAVKNSRGNPVPNAEIALFVVDDAILSLTGYRIPDPQSVFFCITHCFQNHLHNRDQFRDVNANQLLPHHAFQEEVAYFDCCCECAGMCNKCCARQCCRACPGCCCAACCSEPVDLKLEGKLVEPDPGFGVRSNFNPLAHFTASKVTDANGSATITITLPDTLTSYRIWAVTCWSSDHFGIGESSILAQLPLAIRPSIPRFLNFGDQSQVAIVVSNQSPVIQNALVGLRTHNVIHTGETGYQVRIEPHKRALLRFPVMTDKVGTAYFQFALSSNEFSDATELSIPVWTPATNEAFATYGELEAETTAIVQPIAAPQESKVFTQFGGLEVTTSSTALSALTDAFLYLLSYPFDCVEQLTSRAITTIALEPVLKAFNVPELPSPDTIKSTIEEWLQRIANAQKHDGGFGWWNSSSKSSPFISIHVAHLIQRVLERNIYNLSDETMSVPLLKDYLKNIEQHFESYYSQRTKNSLKAFALYVLHRFKESSKEQAVTLYQSAKESIDLEALGWLLVAINDPSAPESQEILHKISTSVVETAETAHFATSFDDTGKHVFLVSSRRTDGILLEALLDTQPKSSLIPKVVKGLLAHKTKGRWGNTQENCFILLALHKYFTVYEKEEPNFIARYWLDEQFAGDATYKGRSTNSHTTKIGMKHIAKAAPTNLNLTIAKEGPGILYYRLGLNYAPRDLALKPSDQGFEVVRTYEAVDNPAHVTKENGVWKIKAGERVRVRLTMTTVSRRYHVALVDKLPAGFEPINPSLKGSEPLPPDPKDGDVSIMLWWFRSWFDHQNFRDERVEAFSGFVCPGAHNYSYIARATSKGTYTAPPAYAEEMYSPEVFGRSSSEVVQIV